jgi:hypothetical protein
MRMCPKCMAENMDTEKFCRQCASPLQQSGGKTCPSGRHTMDPTWTECAYCKQENVAAMPGPAPSTRTPTVFEGQAPPRGGQVRPPTYKEDTPLPPRPPRPVNGPPAPPTPPQATPGQPGRQRAHTVFSPVMPQTPGTGQPTPSVARDRKIVGILVTYSWSPEGQIYPLREGRNFIGRDQDCEVCIPEDQTLSGRNSHITYRQNFVIGDMVSMTGTDVDNVPIEEQFRSLDNYATIRAGSTYFTFMAVAPRPSGATAEPSHSGDVAV